MKDDKERFARVRVGLQKQGVPCVHDVNDKCDLKDGPLMLTSENCIGCTAYEPKSSDGVTHYPEAKKVEKPDGAKVEQPSVMDLRGKLGDTLYEELCTKLGLDEVITITKIEYNKLIAKSKLHEQAFDLIHKREAELEWIKGEYNKMLKEGNALIKKMES